MAKGKNKWMIVVFIAVAVIIAAGAIYYYFFRVSDPNKNNEPVPPGSPTPKWVPEYFPLNLGMYGTKIKALQAALGITQDGKFGPQTNAAILAKGYSVPLSQNDYNAIINSKGGSAAQNIPGAYANFDGVAVYYVSNLSLYKKFNKGQWIGNVTDEDPTDSSYWIIDGVYKVAKASVTNKG